MYIRNICVISGIISFVLTVMGIIASSVAKRAVDMPVLSIFFLVIAVIFGVVCGFFFICGVIVNPKAKVTKK